MLAIPSHLVLSLLLPVDRFAVLPGIVSLWVTGRLLFFIGYSADHPMGREVGFQLTFIPTVIVVVYNFCFGFLVSIPR